MTKTSGAEEILKERRKKIFSVRTLVLILFSLILCYLIFRDIQIKDLVAIFTSINPVFLVMALALYCLSNLLKAYRFHLLMHEFSIPMIKLFTITSFHNFFNFILPARTGELTLLYYLNTIGGVQGGRGLHSLVVARILDLFIVGVLFLGAFVAFSWSYLPTSLALMALALVVVSFLALIFVNRLVVLGASLLEIVVTKSGAVKVGIIAKVTDKIVGISREFASQDIRSHFFRLVGVSLAVWLVLYSFFYVIMLAFNIDISFPRAVAGSTGMVLTNVLPVNGVGSVGSYEAGWTAGLMLVGVEQKIATVSSLSAHIVQFIVSLIVAGSVFIVARFTFLKKKRDGL